MATTLHRLHSNHGVTVGQDVTPMGADALLGEFVRTGVDVSIYQTSDREHAPMDVWAQRNDRGEVETVVEYA